MKDALPQSLHILDSYLKIGTSHALRIFSDTFHIFLAIFHCIFCIKIHNFNYLQASGCEKQTKYLWDNAATDWESAARTQKRARPVLQVELKHESRQRRECVRVCVCERGNEWTDVGVDVNAFSQWLIITHFVLFFILCFCYIFASFLFVFAICIFLWINHFNERTFSRPPQPHCATIKWGGVHLCCRVSCAFLITVIALRCLLPAAAAAVMHQPRQMCLLITQATMRKVAG